MIPYDMARRNARKVEHTYIQKDAENAFEYEITPTKHSWEVVDMNRISRFLAEQLLGITPEDAKDEEFVVVEDITPLIVQMPEDAISTDEVAENLTNRKMRSGTTLQEVYVPTYEGQSISTNQIVEDIGRGEVMRIWAQMECALKGGE